MAAKINVYTISITVRPRQRYTSLPSVLREYNETIMIMFKGDKVDFYIACAEASYVSFGIFHVGI